MLHEQSQPVQASEEEFLNERQVANLICQSVRTIQKWRVTGYGPEFYKLGRSVRYLRSEVIA